MAGNSNSGGRRKHAGRKSNAAKLLDAGFVAPFFNQKLQEIKWLDFLEADDPRIRLDAVKYLTDRIYGKAVQTVDSKISGELSVNLAETIAKARQRSK